jgi:hypothetical protein
LSSVPQIPTVSAGASALSKYFMKAISLLKETSQTFEALFAMSFGDSGLTKGLGIFINR